jgi:thymidylate synthase (FAD)
MNRLSSRFLFLSLLVSRLCAMDLQQPAIERIDPLNDGLSSLKLVSSIGDDLKIVNEARFPYGTHSTTFSDADREILTLIVRKHKKPLDLTSLQFHVKLPIKLAYEWEANNLDASYNEQSARYSKLNKYYIPILQDLTQDAVEPFRIAVEASFKAYSDLTDIYGIPQELARGVLPKCTYTQFFVTCSLRSLFRCVKKAYQGGDPAMIQYANGLLTLAEKHFPKTVEIWRETHKDTLHNDSAEKKFEEIASAHIPGTQLVDRDKSQQALDPLNNGISSVKLLGHDGSDLGIATAARISYDKHDQQLTDGGQRLLKTLSARGHTSPFEQTFIEYYLKVPFYIARHIVRHRIGISRSDEPMLDQFEAYVPSNWRKKNEGYSDSEISDIYTRSITASVATYTRLRELGIARNIASYIRPVCGFTEFNIKFNLQSLAHFEELRADPAAQWEIQQYAKAMLQLAEPKFPIAISCWREKQGALATIKQALQKKLTEGQPTQASQAPAK